MPYSLVVRLRTHAQGEPAHRAVFLLIFSLQCVQPSARADESWVQRYPAPSPAARESHCMAYDSARGVTVLFGGSMSGNETWEYDGSTWTQVATPGPGARTHAAMVYESGRNVTLLFGGDTGSAQGDTWEFNGSTWIQVATTGPCARYGQSMAYDSARGVGPCCSVATAARSTTTRGSGIAVVGHRSPSQAPAGGGGTGWPTTPSGTGRSLFGGYGGSYLDDTWEYDGSTWTQVATTGPKLTRRSPYGLRHRAEQDGPVRWLRRVLSRRHVGVEWQ